MKQKRFLFTLVLLLMIFCTMFVTASAAETVKSGKCGDNLTWTFDSEGTLTISGTGPMYDYSYKSGESPEPWADLGFKTIVVKSGVTTIGAGAFDNSTASRVSSISLPNTLTTIGDFAFRFLEMETITIPDSVTSIGKSAFEQCRNLQTLQLSNNLKSISEYMFVGCSALETLVIPDSRPQNISHGRWAIPLKGSQSIRNILSPLN